MMNKHYTLCKRGAVTALVLIFIAGFTYAANEEYATPWDGTTSEPALTGSTNTELVIPNLDERLKGLTKEQISQLILDIKASVR